MKIFGRSVCFLSAILIVLLVGVACVPPTSPAPLPVAATAPISPIATPAPASAATLTTDSLIASVAAGLPPSAFEGVAALPLDVPPGQRPLWAVHSYGMRNFDLKPSPDHFIAIFTQENGAWQELARLALVSDDIKVAGPDYLGENGVTQVQIAPSRIWLQVEGGAGAHSGVFDLVSFDGNQLSRDLNAFAPSPGVGRVQDVNGDGQPDVVINASDPYVFCYACGVVKIGYAVYNWDEAQGQFVDVPLQEMLMGQSGHPGRAANNEAVMLARAGLWKDAAPKIVEAQQISANVQSPFSNAAIDWNFGIIKLTAAAMAKHAKNSGYPLLSNVFYGDYAAAVDLMRPYPPAQIFTSTTPLVVGTVAEGWLPQLTQPITASATSALQVKPDLAAAYFLRGWAEYLADPVNLLPQAKSDVTKAASLAPNDALYKQSAAFLAQPVSPAKLPAVKSPTVKPPATTPKPVTATPIVQGKRIQFAPGATSGEVTGQVGPGQIDEYLLKAQAGQWMLVRCFLTQERRAPSGHRTQRWAAVPALGGRGHKLAWQAACHPGLQPQGGLIWSGRALHPPGHRPGAHLVQTGRHRRKRRGQAGGAGSARIRSEGVQRSEDDRHDPIAAQRCLAGDLRLRGWAAAGARADGRDDLDGVLPATQDYGIKAVAVGGPTGYKLDVTVK